MATVDKKLVKSKSGYRMIPTDERITSPFTVEEPHWTPDYSCSNCENVECKMRFDFFNRKHHCRRCGKCFCDNCTNNLVALPRMSFIDPVRQCKACALVSKRENEFFDKHLRILLDGGEFKMHFESEVDGNNLDMSPEVDDNDLGMSPARTLVCALSPDHRYLEFKGDTPEQESITIHKIASVEVSGAGQEGQVQGMTIQYRNDIGEPVWLRMNVDNNSECRQQSMNWLTAMMKAFKLMTP